MKFFKLLLLIAGLLAAPFAIQAADAPASAAQPSAAGAPANVLTVVGVSGDVVNVATGKSVNVGDAVSGNMKLKLPKGARLILEKADKSVVLIQGPSDVTIAYGANGAIALTVNGGQVTVQQTKGTTPVEVTANGTKATIPAGTTANVSSDNGATRVVNVEGQPVTVVTQDGQPTNVAPGNGNTYSTGADGKVTTTASNPTPAEVSQIKGDANDAKTQARQPVEPANSVQPENTVPTNPDTVLSGEEVR